MRLAFALSGLLGLLAIPVAAEDLIVGSWGGVWDDTVKVNKGQLEIACQFFANCRFTRTHKAT